MSSRVVPELYWTLATDLQYDFITRDEDDGSVILHFRAIKVLLLYAEDSS